MSLTLRETGGVPLTLSSIAATLTDVSGSSTVAQFTPVELFGASRVPGNGSLASTGITVAGPYSTASTMTTRVTFSDDRGHSGSAESSSGVRFELTGNWSGPLRFPTRPTADLSRAAVTLVQSGDDLTGEVVSRDGIRFPLTGRLASIPYVSLPCIESGLGFGGVQMSMQEFDFAGGRARRVAGTASGRCPGTVVGSFELERVP